MTTLLITLFSEFFKSGPLEWLQRQLIYFDRKVKITGTDQEKFSNKNQTKKCLTKCGDEPIDC